MAWASSPLSSWLTNTLAVAGSMDESSVCPPSSSALVSPPTLPRPSSIISGIICEPLKGLETLCPIGDSFDSPELSLPLWLASSETTIKNFVVAKHVPADKFLKHTRVVCLPGFTATVRDELEALIKVAGPEALKLVSFKDDPINRRIVSSWPPAFDNTYPLSLGFLVDEGGMEPIVRQFQKDVAAGIA